MTKERLTQYRGLVKEIEQLDRQIEQLKKKGPDTATAAVTSAAEFPYSKHTVIVEGLAIGEHDSKLSRILKKRERLLRQSETELELLEDYIESVPDASLRTVMRYKFIDGEEWRWISRKVYERLDESYSRKKVERFLNLSVLSVSDDVQ